MEREQIRNDITPLSHLEDGKLKWLFLDLNSFFASVEQQEHPALRNKPVAVVPMMTDSTCAIAASYEAKAYGIKTGTKIYEAKRLCPDLYCLPARHDIYVDYHNRIIEEIERHLPVTKICSIDEVACRLSRPEQDRIRSMELAREIKHGIRQNVGMALGCSIGIAPNKFLAKIASDMEKPNGLTVLEHDALPGPLFDLKLTDLTGINTRMEQRLNRGHVYTVRQFWNLSPKHARKIWGSVEGERFWYKLRGYNIPDIPTQKSVVGHSRVLEPRLRRQDQAYGVARRLTTKAATRLRRYNLCAGSFSLRVGTVDNRKWADARRFSHAQDNFTFLQALYDMWYLMSAETGHCPLRKVSICLHDLCPPDAVTPDLFEQHDATVQKQHKNHQEISLLMDTLNKRFGANTVELGCNSPENPADYVGTKIAFTRIPERDEFHE